MLLFPLATIFKSANAFAADPPESEYQAALAAISDGAYYITTDVNGTKFYVTQGGGLTDDIEVAYMFGISKVNSSAAADKLFDTAWKIEPDNGSHFSNTTLTDNKANLLFADEVYRQDGGNNRDDWERQIFYLNPETGKYAIRSCNTSYAEESWKDAGRAFWTWYIKDTEAEYVAPTPCYSYDVAYIWSFELPEEKVQIKMVLEGIYNTYVQQAVDDVDEPTSVNMYLGEGPGYGTLADWDTWRKFKAELDKIDPLLMKFFDEDYNPATDPDCPDLDGANALKNELDSMWTALLASEIPYKIPQDGYYRIITRMRYYTDKEIRDEESGELIDTERTYVTKAALASYDKNFPGNVMFGTLKENMANQVWKLTQVGDSILMQNVGMGTYPNIESSSRFLLTDDPTKISHVMFDYAANDIVDIDDEDQDFRDIFYIRLASDPRHVERYLHQNGHSRGKDSHKDLDMGFWRGTYGMGGIYETDEGTSEWYLEPVPEEDIAALVEAFQPILHHDILVQDNQELRDEVAAAIEDAKDIIREDMITAAAQLSSPNSDEAEGTNIGNLIDNDGGTFWHTSWHGSNQEPQMVYNEGSYHYLQIAGMEKMVGNVDFYFRQRNGADQDHPAEVTLFGSEDPEAADADWVEFAKLTIPNVGNGAENHIPFTVENAYPYVRLIVTKVKKQDGSDMDHRTYWHAAEIQFSTVKDNPSSRFVALGEIATNLVDALNENLAIDDADIEFKDYEKLLQAYELFKGGLVDPTELRNALAKYAKVTEGVVEGTEPGQWASTDVAKGYDKLYAEAKAYEAGGKYTPEQIHQYAAMLKAMSKSVAEQVNGVKTGTWYRIMFPTEEMYDKYGFDKSPADKTSLREDQAIMMGTFVAPAYEVTEEEAAPTEEDPEAVANVTHLETYEKDAVSDASRLFFMADDEIEDKDLSEFRFIERPQEEANYVGLFSEVMENSAVALDLSTTYTRGDALITDAKQLSSNASDEAEGKNLNDLIDGNPSTFWHSDWHQKARVQPYLQVALNEPVSGLIQVGLVRRGNDFGHIIRMYVQGSNDAESWTNIGHFTTPYTSPGETVFSPAIDLGGSYSYLRFTITRRAGNDVEFDPFQEITSASPYDKDGGWTYFHSAEFQLYPLTADKEPVATAKELQNTYNDLNKVVNIYKNPTAENFTAAKQAYSAYQREFNTSVGKAVLPSGAEKAAPQYAIQNKANGMFINSTDGNSNDLFLKLTPTFFRYSSPGYERSLLAGTNLNGSATNNLHAGETNRRLCTWTSAEPYSNSALVIREVEAAEPSDFNFNLSIKTGEIYNFTSPVSITNNGDGVAYVGLGQYADTEGVTYLALKKVETIEAGQPAFYILGDTTQYDAEEDPELVKFAMPAEPEFKLVGDTINGFVACMVNQPIGANDIIFDANFATSLGKTGYNLVAPGVLVNMALCPEVDATVEYDFAICLDDPDAVDGIKDVASTIKKISQPGDVYSIDGKLLKTGATLNNLKSLGQGTYILNGVKILVK